MDRLDNLLAAEVHPNKSKQCRRQIIQRLKANLPRAPSCLEAIWDPVANQIVSDPAEVAMAGRAHWQKVFNAVEVDEYNRMLLSFGHPSLVAISRLD